MISHFRLGFICEGGENLKEACEKEEEQNPNLNPGTNNNAGSKLGGVKDCSALQCTPISPTSHQTKVYSHEHFGTPCFNSKA